MNASELEKMTELAYSDWITPSLELPNNTASECSRCSASCTKRAGSPFCIILGGMMAFCPFVHHAHTHTYIQRPEVDSAAAASIAMFCRNGFSCFRGLSGGCCCCSLALIHTYTVTFCLTMQSVLYSALWVRFLTFGTRVAARRLMHTGLFFIEERKDKMSKGNYTSRVKWVNNFLIISIILDNTYIESIERMDMKY